MKKLSRDLCQFLWVHAALERLQTLGFIGGVELFLTEEGIDTFLAIDEHRHVLFDRDEELDNLVRIAVKSNCSDCDELTVNTFIYLVREYKDNRTEMMQVALNEII